MVVSAQGRRHRTGLLTMGHSPEDVLPIHRASCLRRHDFEGGKNRGGANARSTIMGLTHGVQKLTDIRD